MVQIEQCDHSRYSDIILKAKDEAIRLVDHERTLMYWQIGQRIFEEEQQGKDRLITAIISLSLLLIS